MLLVISRQKGDWDFKWRDQEESRNWKVEVLSALCCIIIIVVVIIFCRNSQTQNFGCIVVMPQL